MDDQLKQVVDNAVLEAEVKQNAEHAMQIGIFAFWFVKGARLTGEITFDQAVDLYGTYLKAIAAGNHCHGENDDRVTND